MPELIPEPKANWYVVSGGPSCGKSTTVELLRQRGYRVTQEHARAILDEEMAKGRTLEQVRGEGECFQNEILIRQLDQESELAQHETIFFDRGIPDGLAYERYLQLIPNPELTRAAQQAKYRTVFILDTLLLDQDSARIEDEAAQEAIHTSICQVYGELGFEVVPVAVMSAAERVEHILAHIATHN